jgi:hypothetical protein
MVYSQNNASHRKEIWTNKKEEEEHEEQEKEKRMHTVVGIGMLFCELMGILRTTIQRIINEVMQDAYVLSAFNMNYYSKFESYRTKTKEAISDQNSGSS